MVTTISLKLTSLLLVVLKHFRLLALTIPSGTEAQVTGLSKTPQISLKATVLLVEPTLITDMTLLNYFIPVSIISIFVLSLYPVINQL